MLLPKLVFSTRVDHGAPIQQVDLGLYEEELIEVALSKLGRAGEPRGESS